MSINHRLPLLISKPELFKYYSEQEIATYAKQKLKKKNNYGDIEEFIRKYLKNNIDINDGKGNLSRFKDAIAKSIGYQNFGELKNKHKPYIEKIHRNINSIDIPNTNELIGELGGWTTDKYTENYVLLAVFKKYPVLNKLYRNIDSLFEDIYLRKNSIVKNTESHDILKTYCFLQVIRKKPFMFFEEKPTESSNYDIIMLSLFAHEIINLPGPWSEDLLSSKRDMDKIDYHHELEARNKYLKVRFESGLLTAKSNILFTSPVRKNTELFDRIFYKYKDVADVIESDLDYTGGHSNALPDDYPSGEEYFNHLKLDKGTLVEGFYREIENIDKNTIKENIYGLEYIRIALILLTSINKENIFARLGDVFTYFSHGFDLLNPKMETDESYKERLPQFI